MKQYGEPVWGMVEEKNPVVQIRSGKIQGETREKVAIFHGIPYGDRCDGDRRFLPPQPVKSWNDIRDCTKNAPYAVQLGESIAASYDFGPFFSGGHKEKFGVEGEVQDENCLYLNVVTPGIDDKKRPVIFYIHGGGFAFGSGAEVTGADRLVREQDIVLVGVNHRLNAFGYLYLGDFDEKYKDSGMAGMLDLVLALEWVRDNIAVFGGDPEKVTLLGESGGGMKINTLMAMEKAKGLFRGAFISSGCATVANYSTKEAAKDAEKFLASLDIKTTELDKLLKLPARQIAEATRSWGFGPNPVADNRSLQYQPAKHWVPAECFSPIPVVVGASEDEMAVFAPEENFHITWDTILEQLTSGDNATTGDQKQEFSREAAEDILRVFREQNRKDESAAHTYIKILSQAGFLGAGPYYESEELTKLGKAPVYRYLVRRDVPHLFPERGNFAWHTAELPLILRIVLYPELEEQSHMMGNMLGAFARTGNPSVPERQWPEYDLDSRQVMVFDDTVSVQEDPLAEEREVLQKWNILP